MILYTADPHFGHANIVRMCNRPFDCVEEMDEYMIAAWNRKVKPNDTVYIVGDFAHRNANPAHQYLERLNGKKILVLGNHDKPILENKRAVACFESILPITHIFDESCGGHHISICHYPLLTWPGKKGSYMIYGHVHNQTDNQELWWQFLKQNDRAFNAGADINNYEPVTLEELIENNKRFKAIH